MNLDAPGGAFEVRSNILWPVAFSWEWEQPSWKGNKTLWSFKSLLPANRRKSSWRFLTLSRQWIRARSSLRSWWGRDQSLGEVEIRSATLTRNVSTVSRHRCCNNIWNGCQRPVQVAVISIQMLPNTLPKKFKPQAVLSIYEHACQSFWQESWNILAESELLSFDLFHHTFHRGNIFFLCESLWKTQIYIFENFYLSDALIADRRDSHSVNLSLAWLHGHHHIYQFDISFNFHLFHSYCCNIGLWWQCLRGHQVEEACTLLQQCRRYLLLGRYARFLCHTRFAG